MPLVSVAVEFVEIHRKDSSDAEIARALRDQGFSDELILAAFRAAGERPAGSAPAVKVPAARRAVTAVLFAVCAVSLIASAVLFVQTFTRPLAAARAPAPR
jgi:hypothetical protein